MMKSSRSVVYDAVGSGPEAAESTPLEAGVASVKLCTGTM